jgi:uncharacterized protein (DUF2384 family)
MKNKENQELVKVLSNHPDIYESLIKLFNSEESALSWLRKPSKPLCNAKPIDLLNSEPIKVRDIIYRIQTGDIS